MHKKTFLIDTLQKIKKKNERKLKTCNGAYYVWNCNIEYQHQLLNFFLHQIVPFFYYYFIFIKYDLNQPLLCTSNNVLPCANFHINLIHIFFKNIHNTTCILGRIN